MEVVWKSWTFSWPHIKTAKNLHAKARKECLKIKKIFKRMNSLGLAKYALPNQALSDWRGGGYPPQRPKRFDSNRVSRLADSCQSGKYFPPQKRW
jgi:hypothetical protein